MKSKNPDASPIKLLSLFFNVESPMADLLAAAKEGDGPRVTVAPNMSICGV